MVVIKFLLPGLLAIIAAYAALFALKRLAPRMHTWFTAKTDRIAWLGIGVLLLAWVAVAMFNNLNGPSAA
jgi:uncharacterized membrane protein required for colicin V production